MRNPIPSLLRRQSRENDIVNLNATAAFVPDQPAEPAVRSAAGLNDAPSLPQNGWMPDQTSIWFAAASIAFRRGAASVS
jgi:hypothetical protein